MTKRLSKMIRRPEYIDAKDDDDDNHDDDVVVMTQTNQEKIISHY